ncbi:MAG: alcohol dehydrogenase catalytic domain-containing protein [Bryobacteraceae bacterium]
MRTVELVEQRKLEVMERPEPAGPEAGEVLVRLKAVGLCGSDLHWYEDGGIGSTSAIYPMILGHEPVGEVVAIGQGVTSHKEGDKVAIEPSITCGHCEFCRSGRPNNCPECIFMGGTQKPGFFRELAAVPARNAEHFPAEFDWLTATLIEPVAVVVHAWELIRFRVGDTVAVFGAGPIGLLCANMAKIAGAAKVFIVDRAVHRLRIARQISEDFVTIHSTAQKPADAILEATRGRGVDIVIDAAGAPETIQASIQAARSSGQFLLIGIPGGRNSFAVDIHGAMNKELAILTLKRSNHKGFEAMDLIRAGKIPDLIITHRIPLENTAEGFDMAVHCRDGIGKLVVELH